MNDAKNNKIISVSIRGLRINSIIINLILVILLSIGLSLIGIMISSVFSTQIIKRYLDTPKLLIMNTLPLTLTMLLIYIASSRLWVSYFLGGGIFILFQVINRFKMKLRQEPFIPTDLTLGNEITKVVKLEELPVSKNFLIMLIALILFGFFLMFLIKSKSTKIVFKSVGIIITVAISLTLFFNLYNNGKFYNSFKIYGSQFSSVDITRSRGFMYSFIHKIHSSDSKKPDGYSAKNALLLLDKFNTPESSDDSFESELPHVIAIMSEAFFDIDKIPGVSFTENNNALKNYKKIIKDSYTGKLVTNVFGGGTAKTEYAFLTGQCQGITGMTSDAYSTIIRKNTFSLSRVFKDKGYYTTALHPGFSWFYNRQNVYEYFGFEKRIFRDDMNLDSSKDKVVYLTDRDTFDFLLDDLYTHIDKETGKPYFNFTVTIHNHGPYANNSIGYKDIMKRNPKFDAKYYHMINNYTAGLKQCDAALGYLVEQLNQTEEPVVLLYFGDHLPFLGTDFAGYKAMNYPISDSGDMTSFINTYETPYFIWSNNSAKHLLELKEKKVKGKAPTISSNYLGAELLNYLGYSDSSFFNYLNNLKASMPVITNRFYKKSNGKFTEVLSEKDKSVISQYKNLQYYMLFDKDVE